MIIYEMYIFKIFGLAFVVFYELCKVLYYLELNAR